MVKIEKFAEAIVRVPMDGGDTARSSDERKERQNSKRFFRNTSGLSLLPWMLSPLASPRD
jgi:hypothetical protein